MFIILDTEYTSWPGTNEKGYNMKTKFPELVQISAIKVDKDFNIVNRLNIYVKPIINPKLSEYFKRLTKMEYLLRDQLRNCIIFQNIIINY